MDRISVSERLNETTALQLSADLTLLSDETDVEIDFSSTRHFEPFGMLLVRSAVARAKRRLGLAGKALSISPIGIDPDGIAAHMGFWQSLGLQVGRPPGVGSASTGYLPISRIGLDELFRESGGVNPLVAGTIEHRSRELASVLSVGVDPRLGEALTYSFRELIRNVVEHAMCPELWIAGMSWPKRDYVQVAVVDDGIGIRRSLSSHVNFRFDDDLASLREALKPSVSRNLGREPTRDQIERHAEARSNKPLEAFMNSGYGLYLISSFCRDSGQFLIASGSAALAQIGAGDISTSTAHAGTALRIVLYPSQVGEAFDRTFEALSQSPRAPMISASKLRSLGLSHLVGKRVDAPPNPATDKPTHLSDSASKPTTSALPTTSTSMMRGMFQHEPG